MKLRLGSPRAALVVAPHPDDEVIGAFGLIQALRRLGTRVRVLVVTDGAGSHRASPTWPRARLVRRRRRETLWAMRRLGVPASAVVFLGLPDGGLTDLASEARARIARAARRTRDLDLLVGPDPQDDHADHRVVAQALAGVRLRRRLAYPVWPATAERARGVRTLLVPGGALAKRATIGLYRTQTGMIADDPRGFALTAAQVRHFSQPRERFIELRP